MKLSRANRRLAISRVDVLCITVVLAALAGLMSVGLNRSSERARRSDCANNLMQIGLAFRHWCLDGGDKPPTQVAEESGGAKQSIARGQVFRVFQVMSNELNTPKVLVCPSDSRTSAPSFVALMANTNVSYFVGLDADDTWPKMFWSGDRNLEIDGVSAPRGIVALTTNNIVDWTSAIHDRHGNVGLADGSVQSFDGKRINKALAETGTVTNRLVFP